MATTQTTDHIQPGAAASDPQNASSTTSKVPKSKNRKLTAALIGVGVVAAGVLGYYFLLPKIKGKTSSGEGNTPSPEPKTNDSGSNSNNHYAPPAPSPAPKPSAPPRNDNFPLKQGSKGPNVVLLQNALMAKYGKSILPKYGADGDFGTETISALKSKGLSTTIDQSTFISLTEDTKVDPDALAHDIVAATILGFSKVVPLLSKIKTAQDYKAVSDKFKTYRVGAVHYASLLTGMFDQYTEPNQQSQLRQIFTSMGLIYKPDTDSWSLPSNLSGFNLITTQTTHVWPDAKTAIQVPPNMVLGQELERQGEFIAFENAGRTFLVPAAHVRYA